MTVISLWVPKENGVQVIAASTTRLVGGALQQKECRIGAVSEHEKRAALQSWRSALLGWVRYAQDLQDAKMVAEIIQYGQLSGDHSVHDAWLSEALGWEDCETKKKAGDCASCCEETGDKIRRWGCGVLVTGLSSIGSCLLVGGPLNPLGCSVAGTFGGLTGGAACKGLVDRREKECANICSEKPGDKMSARF